MTRFLGFPTHAAFLTECERVRLDAARQYRAIDTPARIRSRQRAARTAAARVLPWE